LARDLKAKVELTGVAGSVSLDSSDMVGAMPLISSEITTSITEEDIVPDMGTGECY